MRGDVVLGDHCVIGHASEVKNSVFLNGAHAPHFAYVGDSIPVSYTHLRAHETVLDLVCRLLLEKKKTITPQTY